MMMKEMLIQEAQQQTLAINRLGVWMRMSASFVAIGMLLAWWGIWMEAGYFRGVCGIILAIASGIISIIIRRGRNHGKENVRRILAATVAGENDVESGIQAGL